MSKNSRVVSVAVIIDCAVTGRSFEQCDRKNRDLPGDILSVKKKNKNEAKNKPLSQ
ncbi:hypothetical protein ACQUWL_28040 [Serratia marcescens]|uniref:hypothetical protein n=1 Tax=Serratia marcescens TaxID=615 RepID=UPI003D16A108